MTHKSLRLGTINNSSDLEQTFWLFQLGTIFQSHACNNHYGFLHSMSSKLKANFEWQWHRCHPLPPIFAPATHSVGSVGNYLAVDIEKYQMLTSLRTNGKQFQLPLVWHWAHRSDDWEYSVAGQVLREWNVGPSTSSKRAVSVACVQILLLLSSRAIRILFANPYEFSGRVRCHIQVSRDDNENKSSSWGTVAWYDANHIKHLSSLRPF